METIKNYIYGEWRQPSGDKKVFDKNPANFDEILAEFKLSTEEDLYDAVKASTKSFSSWKNTPAPVRGEILFKAADLIEERRKELALAFSKEGEKTYNRANNEVTSSIRHMKFQDGKDMIMNGKIISEYK